jgi:hypothetical protein
MAAGFFDQSGVEISDKKPKRRKKRNEAILPKWQPDFPDMAMSYAK